MTIRLSRNPLDEIPEDYNIPYTTTATIDQYNEVVENIASISEQMADVDRNILYRQFNEYSNLPDSNFFIEKVNLGYYDETYEGDNYFSLITEYKQTLYETPFNKDEDTYFYEWFVTDITYRKDTQYKNKLVQTLNWERPFEIVTNTRGGVNNSGNENDEGSAGTSIRYLSISDPFVLTVDCNNRIAARIETDADSDNVTIVAHSDPNVIEGEVYSINQEIICSKRYITITIVNTNNNVFDLFESILSLGKPEPTFVNFKFYGEFLFNTSIPINYTELPAMIHPDGTELEVRLFPPGKYQQFPDSFWNSGPKPPIIEEYSNRTGEATFV